MQITTAEQNFVEYHYIDELEDIEHIIRKSDGIYHVELDNPLPYDDLIDITNVEIIMENDTLSITIGFVGDLISILNTTDISYLVNENNSGFILIPTDIWSLSYDVHLTLDDNTCMGYGIGFRLYITDTHIYVTSPSDAPAEEILTLNKNNITFSYVTNSTDDLDLIYQRDKTVNYLHDIFSQLRYNAIEDKRYNSEDDFHESYGSNFLSILSTDHILYIEVFSIVVIILAKRKKRYNI